MHSVVGTFSSHAFGFLHIFKQPARPWRCCTTTCCPSTGAISWPLAPS
jgi:hypothetical protein